VLAGILFGIYSCGGPGNSGTTPSTPGAYPPTDSTTPTTPSSAVVYPPGTPTEEPPTYVSPPVVATTTPPVVASTTPMSEPPTKVPAGSGGAAADEGGTGLVVAGLLLAGVALTALLRDVGALRECRPVSRAPVSHRTVSRRP
jgi:hypothetical protein